MSIEIIPLGRWSVFLERFTVMHKSNLVNIEILTFNRRNTSIVNKLRLLEIKTGLGNSTVITGEIPGAEITEFISKVKNISLEKDKYGLDKTLFINSICEGTVAIKFK